MDVERVKRRYRRLAPVYDRLLPRATEGLRREAVRRLDLGPGDRGLDLGCGTGLSLALLRDAVGGSGRVYGVEVSPEMLTRAQKKVAKAGWGNVHVIEADAERFELDDKVDGILCFYTHDIMMSPTALPHALKHLRPGGRLVAAGGKLARGWQGWLINPITVVYSLPFITRLDRSRDPFALMRELVDGFQLQERLLGSQYLAWGVKPRN